MSQNFGFTSRVFTESEFLGEHPPITKSGVLASGSLVSGSVLGMVAATKKYVQLAPSAVDGSEVAAAILLGDLDASAAEEPGIIVVHGDVLDPYLTWPGGISEAQKATAVGELQAVGVYVK